MPVGWLLHDRIVAFNSIVVGRPLISVASASKQSGSKTSPTVKKDLRTHLILHFLFMVPAPPPTLDNKSTEQLSENQWSIEFFVENLGK